MITTTAERTRPRPICFVSAVLLPALIIATGVALYEHYRHPPHDPYLCVTIIFLSQAAAVVVALILAVCGWWRRERPFWLGIAGIAVTVWFLWHLLFG
jgi:hypothetical protein